VDTNRAAGFTEKPDTCPAFRGAEAGEAEVRQLPLVLIDDVLSPAGSDVVIAEV